MRGLILGEREEATQKPQSDSLIISTDPSHVLEHVWKGLFSSPESFFLAREVSDLAKKPGFDQLLSFQVAQGVTVYPHQVNTVKTVIRQMRGRALLCDEVGLGKTVEAGLITMEYLVRGLVKRILILTPPSLVHQWQEEMSQKFNQDFVTSDSDEFEAAGDGAWSRFPHIIASINLAKRAERLKQVTGTRFDLVIVDEAHRLRRRNTAAWKLVNALDKKYILLLTATPVQNDLDARVRATRADLELCLHDLEKRYRLGMEIKLIQLALLSYLKAVVPLRLQQGKEIRSGMAIWDSLTRQGYIAQL